MDRQQEETLHFFSTTASEWLRRAESSEPEVVNVIAQRNAVVLRMAPSLPAGASVLDIGCGTGDLCLDMAGLGFEAVGLDFAPEMIEICERRKAERGVSGASFVTASIFDHEPAGEAYDVVSAMGFIEYVSQTELGQLADHVRTLLGPGGRFAVGSRNRLFNVMSLNDFTALEQSVGAVDGLLREAVQLASSSTQEEAVAGFAAGGSLHPVVAEHPRTSIEVTTRHQYTPAELMAILADHGFRAVSVHPINYHAMPVAPGTRHAALRATVANAVAEQYPDDPGLVPYSSSFVLVVAATEG
jgi:2-polyprenyl-3-methyl-5-hydroxy-6-metoxy-1,4-benzoquinol methylase